MQISTSSLPPNPPIALIITSPPAVVPKLAIFAYSAEPTDGSARVMARMSTKAAAIET